MVSVIMPVYGAEKYLDKAVGSILAQTGAEFELILVDDGSPDSCGAICDQFAQSDERVVVVHQKNQGISGARNTGLQKARGEYVMFCDDDDRYHPDFISTAYRAIRREDADVVRFQCKVDGRDMPGAALKKPYVLEKSAHCGSYGEFLYYAGPLFVWNAIYRKALLDRYNIRYNETCRYGLEDFYFNVAVHMAMGKASVHPGIFYDHAERVGQSTSAIRKKNVVKYKFLQEADLLEREWDAVKRWCALKDARAVCNERLAETLARFRHQMKEAGFTAGEAKACYSDFREELEKRKMHLKKWYVVSKAPVKARTLLFLFRIGCYRLLQI